MSSVPVSLADAVTEHLNATNYGMEFYAERVYLPEYSPPENVDIAVNVAPREMTAEIVGRGTRMRREYPVQIGLMCKYGDVDLCDRLMEVAEAISEDVKDFVVANSDVERARPVAMEWNPAYAPQQMRERKLFVSVIEVTYLIQK